MYTFIIYVKYCMHLPVHYTSQRLANGTGWWLQETSAYSQRPTLFANELCLLGKQKYIDIEIYTT